MTCPRCKVRMHTARDEMTKDQGDVVELTAAACTKCINCGHRNYPELREVVPFDKSMLTPKQDLKGGKPGRANQHVDLMRKYYPSIIKMRRGKCKTSWRAIANIIRQADGVRIKPETVEAGVARNPGIRPVVSTPARLCKSSGHGWTGSRTVYRQVMQTENTDCYQCEVLNESAGPVFEPTKTKGSRSFFGDWRLFAWIAQGRDGNRGLL